MVLLGVLAAGAVSMATTVLIGAHRAAPRGSTLGRAGVSRPGLCGHWWDRPALGTAPRAEAPSDRRGL